MSSKPIKKRKKTNVFWKFDDETFPAFFHFGAQTRSRSQVGSIQERTPKRIWQPLG